MREGPEPIRKTVSQQTSEGQAKVIKSCVAMRNCGDGGFVMVGFHNRTAAPNMSVPFADVRGTFHPDMINIW
jgi:hypothetical protein